MTAEELYQKGLDKITENQFDAAIDFLTRAIALEPQNPFFYNHRSVAYLNINKYELAMFDMNKSIALDESYAYFYSCRGFLKAKLRDAEGAVADYEKSLELDPDNEITYNNLGLVLEQMGNATSAQKMYKKGNDILGYNPEDRVLNKEGTHMETKSESAEENTKEEEPEPLTKSKANKQRKQLAKDVFSNKSAFKEFLSFIGNGFKLKNDDKEGKS